MRQYRINSFRYGLRNLGGPALFADQELKECLNIDLTGSGLVQTRKGATYAVGTEPETTVINSIKYFEDSSENKRVVFTTNKKIYHYNVSTEGYNDITGDSAQTAGANVRYQYAVATNNNKTAILVGTNGTDKPWYWTPSAIQVSDIDDAPDKAKAVCWSVGNRLLFGNIHDGTSWFPNKIVYSGDRTPLTMDGDDTLLIGNAGDPIKAIVSVQNYDIVLKKHSVWRMSSRSIESLQYTPTDVEITPYQVKQITDGAGCVAPESVVVFDNVVYFMGEDGYYSYDTRGDNEDAVQRVDLKIDWANATDSRKLYCHAVPHTRRNQIRLWVPESGENTANQTCFYYAIHPYLQDRRYAFRQPAWTRNKLEANCSTAGLNSDDEQVIYCGDFDGYINVMENDEFNDNDALIDSWFTTGETSCGVTQKKTFHYLEIVGEAYDKAYTQISQYQEYGRLVRREYADLSDIYAPTLPVTLPFYLGKSTHTSERVTLGGSSSTTSFKIRCNTIDNGFAISTMLIGFDIAL